MVASTRLVPVSCRADRNDRCMNDVAGVEFVVHQVRGQSDFGLRR